MALWTGCLGQRRLHRGAVIDVTVKSAVGDARTFAPTWDLVMGSKQGRLTWAQYTAGYYALLRERYRQDPGPFDRLVDTALAEEIVLACYCRNTPHCHRYLLADILAKCAAKRGLVLDVQGECAVV